jgi:hypothetical protein|tara:strand:+ start:873 stop:1559 length:687 start_codon:yes stop_codon:yes gene_type:complete
MTLTQIRTEIRNITGVEDTSVVADSVLTDLINKGQTILADEANLFAGYATRNSVSGTGEYQLVNGNGSSVTAWTIVENAASAGSSNLANMIRIYRIDFGGDQMTRIGMDQIHNISSNVGDVQMPSAHGYYINDISLGIFPIPQVVKEIKVYYYHLPTTLSGDSDVPMIDTRYHECLVYYGSWKTAERLRDMNMISYFKNEWLEWKEKVVMDRQRRAGEPKFSINYKDF